MSVGSVEGCNANSLEDARSIESKYTVSRKENRIDIFLIVSIAKSLVGEVLGVLERLKDGAEEET